MTLTPRDKQNLKTFGYGVLAVLAGALIYLPALRPVSGSPATVLSLKPQLNGCRTSYC